MKRMLSMALLALAGLLVLPGLARVAATDEVVIRMATLAPAGSSWDRIFKAWNKSLSEKTGGSLKFQFFSGGVAGDERDVLRKMKAGQLDAAGITAVGLSQVVRSISLLQLPGVVDDFKQLNEVRTELASDFEGMFDAEGYKLLGWGDAGFGRILGKKPILVPSDYKSVRPWVPRGDAALPELMRIVGANGVPLGIPEVFPALQTGMVDTVICSAIAAVALQWFRHVEYISKEAAVPIVGATLLRKELFTALKPEQQAALLETAAKAHAVLIKQVQAEDDKSYATLTDKMGLKSFSLQATPQQIEAWDKVNVKLQETLTGKLWTQDFYTKVMRVARQAKGK